MLWTSESKFELFGTNQRVYVRRRTGERLIDDCISPTVKHGGGNIMVWGSISGRGVGDLVKIGGIMDKMVYHNILVTHAVPSGRKLDKSHVIKIKETLWSEIKRSWETIRVEVLKKYIETMPERCRAIIKAKGGHTKY